MRLLLSVFLFFITVFPANAQDAGSEPSPIRFDRNHSTLGFNVPIVNGLSKVTGKFTDFTIDLIWNETDLTASSVRLEIQVESIDTGIDGRNNHLKSDDFFDVALHPTITFESKSIRRDGLGYLADGQLTMHGVTRDVSLPLTNQTYTSDAGDSWTVFRVNYKIDRTDYGMNWKHSSVDFFVGDEIETDIVLLTR